MNLLCCSRRSPGYNLQSKKEAKSISNLNNEELKNKLIQAINQKNIQIIEESLRKNENVYINDPLTPNGSTALMIAAQKGHEEIVKLLLEKGADANLAQNNGCTALMLAAGVGNNNIVELLLEKGADANLAHNNGWTALMIAAQDGYKNIVELL
ncbi:ankyrin repeat domain-containing protein, partial [Candidatus Marinamargulisbacteria bacterium]|nr:ankyrin repeat domain-containing protein [Candidatus Marinamargulisbacteria bacterium]